MHVRRSLRAVRIIATHPRLGGWGRVGKGRVGSKVGDERRPVPLGFGHETLDPSPAHLPVALCSSSTNNIHLFPSVPFIRRKPRSPALDRASPPSVVSLSLMAPSLALTWQEPLRATEQDKGGLLSAVRQLCAQLTLSVAIFEVVLIEGGPQPHARVGRCAVRIVACHALSVAPAEGARLSSAAVDDEARSGLLRLDEVGARAVAYRAVGAFASRADAGRG